MSSSCLFLALQLLRPAESLREHPCASALPPQYPGWLNSPGGSVQLRGPQPGDGDPVHRLYGRPRVHSKHGEQNLPLHHRHLPKVQ